MAIPESFPQFLIVVLLLVPGFSFVTVRTWYVGWRSPSYGPTSRLLEAVYVSAIFLVIYACVATLIFSISALWTHRGTLSEVQFLIEAGWQGAPASVTAVCGFLALVGVPGATAVLFNHWTKVTIQDDEGSYKTVRKAINRNQAMPRAWDHAAYAEDSRFVRVKTPTGVYIGGWFDPTSYVSTYPYERDIFIAHQWEMGKKGQFKRPIKGSLGVWVPINDDCIVDWSEAPKSSSTSERDAAWPMTETTADDSPTAAHPAVSAREQSRSQTQEEAPPSRPSLRQSARLERPAIQALRTTSAQLRPHAPRIMLILAAFFGAAAGSFSQTRRGGGSRR